MTTSVYISTTYVHQGKKLRVRAVNPKDESSVQRDLTCTPEKVAEHGGKYEFEVLHVHDGTKLIVEEVE